MATPSRHALADQCNHAHYPMHHDHPTTCSCSTCNITDLHKNLYYFMQHPVRRAMHNLLTPPVPSDIHMLKNLMSDNT